MLALISLPIDQLKAKAHSNAYSNANSKIVHGNANACPYGNTGANPHSSGAPCLVVFLFFFTHCL